MASKSVVALMMVNLAIFAFVSTNAVTCPVLDVNACINIANDLVNAQLGFEAKSDCCDLIYNNIADADLAVCLCTTLKNTPLGTTLGRLLNANGGLGGLTGNALLNKELFTVVNACGYSNPAQYKCPV